MRKIDRQIERLPKNGSYRKRLDDAFAAIEICSPEALPPLSAFILYYLTCEKLAKVVLGIKRGKPGAGDEFNNIKVRSSEIIEACRFIGLRIPSSELNAIFSGQPDCGGWLRNKLFHDFGPTHVKLVQRAAPKLLVQMRRFLQCREGIIEYLNQAE